jgi:hypothetical protein
MIYINIEKIGENQFMITMRNYDFICKMVVGPDEAMSVAQSIKDVVDGPKDSVKLKF